MKKTGMKITTRMGRVFLAVCLMLQLLIGVASANTPEKLAAGRSVNASSKVDNSLTFTADMQEALEEAEQLLYDQKPFSDWAALGFAKNGRAVPKGFLKEKADVILNNGGRFDKYIDMTRTVIAYAAAGGSNINNIAGLDFFSAVLNNPDLEKMGIYELVPAYVVANSSTPYSPNTIPFWYPGAFSHIIMNQQLKDGSWSESDNGKGSTMATAIALTGLSLMSRTLDRELTESEQQALEWLRTQQSVDGGFDFSTAATAQVIIALSSQRMDAAAFALQGGAQPLDFLMSRRLDEGGFSERSDGVLDMTATLHAYLALTAYKLYVNGKERLIDDLNLAAGSAIIQIEGPKGTIAQGRVPSGGKAIDTALAFLKQEGIAYETKTASSGEKVITSIKGIDALQYGGKNGWMFAEYSRYGSWMFPENASSGNVLSDRSRLLLYYGSDTTEVIDLVVVNGSNANGQLTEGRPSANSPFELFVKKANRKSGQLPAPNITVTVGGKTKVTDAKGKVAFAGMPSGVHVVTLTGYRNDAAPAVAKSIFYLSVSAPSLADFKDANQVAEWASENMAHALYEGYIQGVSVKDNVLAPKKTLSRAEFVAMLLRLVHGVTDQPVGSPPFNDVPVGKWYSDEIARAAKLGLTDRTSGRFEPERTITREEAAIMSANAGRLATFGSESRMAFVDIKGLSSTSLYAIQAVNEYKVMIGSDGKFNPQQTLIREQAAAILLRLQRLLYPEKYLD
ncbi:S-layer homology domain-containing protein [Bacillus sp. FJAT-28004]|uniref:S-layer homology domain-containing protein n=1 Tax=Bacillus sp. FJAT-28004 TaxID=1679165 RepID=UPI0006B5A636|nr:S-layer homology domain-containing protein [Bacillus sp. FJAT-28004]